MINVYCDICRKKMDNPITDRTFFYRANVAMCEPCKDTLEVQIKPSVRNKEPFAVEWYEKMIRDILDKAVQKGKI